ncbi:MAG: hypothetical protein O8C61_09095 [Candidatus Methanoperedens sp.]|nr:hypothetical protein [Candidatus Methanoperedens sp.]
MPSKNSLWDFIMSREFITVSTGMVAVINMFNIVFSILTKNALNLAVIIVLIIILFLLMYLTYIRGKIEQNLNLIKEYKSLMTPLKGLVNLTDDTCIWSVMGNFKNKDGFPHCWQYFFDKTGADLDERFYELSAELNKLISNPYLLIFKSNCHISGRIPKKHKQVFVRQGGIYLIMQRFGDLIISYQDQYKKFEEMLDIVNIDKNSFNYDKIKKAQEEFNSALKLSKFEEIRKLSK